MQASCSNEREINLVIEHISNADPFYYFQNLVRTLLNDSHSYPHQFHSRGWVTENKVFVISRHRTLTIGKGQTSKLLLSFQRCCFATEPVMVASRVTGLPSGDLFRGLYIFDRYSNLVVVFCINFVAALVLHSTLRKHHQPVFSTT